jgi:antitoxin MazE
MASIMYAETLDLRLVPIGNSQGLRLPKPLLRAYGFDHHIVAEPRVDGIFLRRQSNQQLSLSQSFAEVAAEQLAGNGEDWSDMAVADADGLEHLPW